MILEAVGRALGRPPSVRQHELSELQNWLSASICVICASSAMGEAMISSSLISSAWGTPSGSSPTSSKSGRGLDGFADVR